MVKMCKEVSELRNQQEIEIDISNITKEVSNLDEPVKELITLEDEIQT